ncbi:MAG: hypothetical protein LC800_23280 [Acidobacteria bacterium]|nr:hypothetical protein [Acidobacteriota bacterium]
MLNSRVRMALIALGFIAVNAVILSYRAAPGASAQLGCSPPPFDPHGIRHTWPQDATVNVNIDSFWSGTLLAAIEKGFDKWEASKLLNCSRVTFNDATNNATPQGIRDGTQLPGTNQV